MTEQNASANKSESAPIPNQSIPIWELVIKDMQDRDHIGRAKYGTPLQAGNGRNALVDAYQEALDLAVYIRQAIEERKTTASVINLPLGPNDAQAATIGEYLRALLLAVWEEGEGFSGKRPFGNGGWEFTLYEALVKAGMVEGKLDQFGYLVSCDERQADKIIAEAIKGLQIGVRQTEKPQTELDQLKSILCRLGYGIRVEPDGSETVLLECVDKNRSPEPTFTLVEFGFKTDGRLFDVETQAGGAKATPTELDQLKAILQRAEVEFAEHKNEYETHEAAKKILITCYEPEDSPREATIAAFYFDHAGQMCRRCATSYKGEVE